MKNITIVCVGKLREPFWEEAAKEYQKRLSSYCDLKVIEVKDSDKMTQRIPDTDHVSALDIRGKKYDSEGFAEHVRNLQETGTKDITFLIGGAEGLTADALLRADERISFSDMTFPHQMARVILLEQLYRGYRIRNGEPYHK